MVVRVGVVGLGVMGADHVETLRRSVAGALVVAVSDLDAARAKQVAGARDGCRAFAEPVDLIGDPDVDAVVVASSDDTHEPFVTACIEARKPVLCEKPLATSSQACLRVVEAEASTGRPLVQVGYMRRFDPSYRDMKKTLDSGALGEALLVHCVHRNVETPPSYRSDMLVTSSAAHEIDVVRWLLGQEFSSASVFVPRSSRHAPRSLRDPQLVVLRTDRGVVVEIEVFVNAGYGYDVRCEVVCEAGTVSLLPPGTVATRFRGQDTRLVPDDWRARFSAAYRHELAAWVEGVRQGRVLGPTAWDGYAVSVTAQACLDAMATEGPARVRLASRPGLDAS